MRRRAFIAMSGSAIAGSLAGCLGDTVSDDGETLDVGGVEVPLVSTPTAFEWYEDGALLVLDARSEQEWREVRITGAKLSPHPDGLDEDDPTDTVSADTRILTYCVCPHSMAGSRAASLIEEGFESVHALDEGLEDWIERGHPVEGTEVDGSVDSVTIPEPDYH